MKFDEINCRATSEIYLEYGCCSTGSEAAEGFLDRLNLAKQIGYTDGIRSYPQKTGFKSDYIIHFYQLSQNRPHLLYRYRWKNRIKGKNVV